MPSTIEFGSHWYAESTGSSNAYVVSLNPSLGSLSTGLVIYMKANFANTNSATVNVDGLGAKTIKKMDGSNLLEGDIPLNAIANLVYDGSNFQLTSVSPSADEELINQNTSNNFRTLDILQGSHPGANIVERGWVDSFGNSNEQGADEANSTGEQHDNTNKLYEGIPGGTNQNSDKDYTTESNYLQQEWTNSNQSTSQATVASGTTVTLSSGTWPTNCEKGRISFDSGSTWFDIETRDSSTQLTLASSATNATSDYIIRMSEFDSGEAKLNNIVGSGFGSDLTSGQTFSASDEQTSTNPVSKAFDDSTTTAWATNQPNTSGWVKVDFGSGNEKVIKQYTIVAGDGINEAPKDFQFEGSNDDTNFTEIDSQTNITGWSTSVAKVFNSFTNTTAYRYYRISIDTVTSGSLIFVREIEMMESEVDNVSSEYVSISDTFAQNESASNWTDINSAARTETLNSQNVYYWLSFDPASSYGAGTEIKIFNQSGSVWRVIAKNDAGTWKYNNNSSNNATFTAATATTNDMLHAVSQAMSSQAANRMTGADLAAITDTEWEAANGFSTSIDSLARGVTLHSTSSTQNPSVDQYRINYDSEIASMDLRSKTFDPKTSPAKAFLWAIAEHSDTDGSGTFSVSRNGGTNWETVTMSEPGEPISGDIRILRSTHTFTTGSGGEDLRARYATGSGKDQKLHAWGLQARD